MRGFRESHGYGRRILRFQRMMCVIFRRRVIHYKPVRNVRKGFFLAKRCVFNEYWGFGEFFLRCFLKERIIIGVFFSYKRGLQNNNNCDHSPYKLRIKSVEIVKMGFSVRRGSCEKHCDHTPYKIRMRKTKIVKMELLRM